MFRFLIWIMVVYMVMQFMMVNKRQKKNRNLIEVISQVKHPEDFFPAVNEYIEKTADFEFVNKGRVVKVWGMAYNRMYDGFEEALNEVNLWTFMRKAKNGYSINANEDSFFYLMLSTPNMLAADGRDDLRTLIDEKLKELEGNLEGQMVKALYEQFNSFYDKEGDRGLSFYEKVLAGDYGEYQYAKSLIGLYKDLVTSMSAQLYFEQGEMEKFEDCKPVLERFSQSGVGERWLKNMQIPGLTFEEVNAEAEVVEERSISEETVTEEVMEVEVIEPEVLAPVKEEETEGEIIDAEFTDEGELGE